MSNAIFIQNPESIYDDQPGRAYNFPKRYLNMVRETIGDWIIFYEGRSGKFGYVSVQKVVDVVPDPRRPDWFYALLDEGSQQQFEQVVPRENSAGIAFEASLRGPDGKPTSGGVNVSAVRRLSKQEFASIVDVGLIAIEGPDAMPRDAKEAVAAPPGFAEAQAPFGGPELSFDRTSVLTERKYRDPAFQRLVKRAYRSRCAISGLSLRNGGGRPEVQAAHIRPVKDNGPDIVQNGLALSGTLHWMFDRGLISIAEDHTVLISHNKVPVDTAQRLINPGQRLILPEDPRDHPHPEYLRYHRENVFGCAA